MKINQFWPAKWRWTTRGNSAQAKWKLMPMKTRMWYTLVYLRRAAAPTMNTRSPNIEFPREGFCRHRSIELDRQVPERQTLEIPPELAMPHLVSSL